MKLLLRRLATILFLMTLVRAVFWLANQRFFPKISTVELFQAFFNGLRFDLSSLFWVNSVLIFASLLPGFWLKRVEFQKFLHWLWLVPNLVLLALELADVAWFPFNLRRTILTDFNLLGETKTQIPQFLMEFWWLVLIVFGFAALLFRVGNIACDVATAGEGLRPETNIAGEGLRRETARPQVSDLLKKFDLKKKQVKDLPTKGVGSQTLTSGSSRGLGITSGSNWLIFLFSIPIWLLTVRGGWQLRPITPIMAVQFVNDPRLAPLLSNATMNLLSSAQQKFIDEKNWLTDAELDAAFSLKKNLGHDPADFRPLNVVTIAFEGAGSEYLERGWMPFLDSLCGLSFCPKNGYANGMRSIQGNAAIVAGIPALMTDPWVFSPYQNNQISGLAAILRQKGYKTAFFHGSDPGSMQLDKLASAAGFEQYFDRTAFPDQSFYDGRWGIFDRPFYQFFCEKIGEMHAPFYAHFFSLTSHHPHTVEPFFEKKYPEMPPDERSFRYADDALRQFFAAASKTVWVENTLFVITGDHTGPERAGRFTSFEGKFRVPILFYKKGESDVFSKNVERCFVPIFSGAGKGGSTISPVAQQIDILPSVLDWLHFPGDFNSFGESFFQKKEEGSRVAYVFETGIYQILDGRFLLTFDGEKSLQLFDYQLDMACTKNILGENRVVAEHLESRLKAIIQRHNRAMIRNQLR